MECDSTILKIIERNIESYKEVTNLSHIDMDGENYIISTSMTDNELLSLKYKDIELWKKYISTIQVQAPILIKKHNDLVEGL